MIDKRFRVLRTNILGYFNKYKGQQFKKATFSFVTITGQEDGEAVFRCRQNGEFVVRKYVTNKLAPPYEKAHAGR